MSNLASPLGNDFPADWKLVQFRSITRKIGSGATPRGGKEVYLPNRENFALVRSQNVYDGRFDESGLAFISDAHAQQLQNAWLQSEDILLNITGDGATFGRSCLVPDHIFPACVNQHTAIIRVEKEHCVPGFILAYLLHPKVKQYIEELNVGGSRRAITKGHIEGFVIALPPLAEQRKIAQILSTWDEAIALVEALIAALKRRKQGLMQRLLTGEVRFPGFDDEWQEVRLGEVFAERNEKGFDHLPLVAITREEGIIWRDELDRRDTSSEDKSNYLRIYPGDIGYNTMRMWQGVSGVSDIEGIVSPAYTICVPNENTDPHFMGYLFKLPATIHTFWRYSQGLVKDTLALKFNNFAQISLHVPPTKQEQSEIARFLRKVDGHITHLSNYKEHLQDEKRGLMQRLLTGEVRVRGE